MKIVFLFLFITSLTSNAQSKIETEDWLQYNLETSFFLAKDFGSFISPHLEKINWPPTFSILYQYRFVNKYLLIIKRTYERRSEWQNSVDAFYMPYGLNEEVWVVDIPKIYVVRISDSTGDSPFLRLSFEENNKTYEPVAYKLKATTYVGDYTKGNNISPAMDYFLSLKSDEIYNVLGNKDANRNMHGYLYLDYDPNSSTTFSMLTRIKKAFEHLIDLEGGHVLKDVF